jgi:hypothetical protein
MLGPRFRIKLAPGVVKRSSGGANGGVNIDGLAPRNRGPGNSPGWLLALDLTSIGRLDEVSANQVLE